MSIKDQIHQAFVFDEDKRSLFLTIISSQVKSGRPLQDIFKTMSRSDNRHYRALAKKSLNPESDYFASDYSGFFPATTAKLLVLAQKFNSVPTFIDSTINNPHRKALSIFSTCVIPSITEIGLCLVSTILFILLYLYNDLLIDSFADFSVSYAYMAGEFLVSNALLLTMTVGIFVALYFYNLRNPASTREDLKKSAGFYRFSDAKFAIEMFRIIGIMTANSSQRGISVRTLINDLAGVYGTNNLRRHQFAIVRKEIGRGRPLHEAIRAANFLDKDSLELFRGLAPTESISEISKASHAVADLLTERTKVEIRFFGKSMSFCLLLYLSLAFMAIIQISMGAGTNLINP